jgi:hypothetical protein
MKIRAILCLAILYALFAAWWMMPPDPRPEWTPEQKKVIVEKMKRHGVDVVECDGGTCWFCREGKRCLL